MNAAAASAAQARASGMTPIAAAATSINPAGTNITAGVRSGGSSSSGPSSSVGPPGAGRPQPRKMRAPTRSTAPDVSAVLTMSTGITQPNPLSIRPASTRDLPMNVPKGGTAANDSA